MTLKRLKWVRGGDVCLSGKIWAYCILTMAVSMFICRLEWLSLTDALTSGVNGLNLSVEDFQNVAAQLLHSQKSALTTVDDVAGTSMESSVEEKMASTPPDLEIPVQAFSLVNSGVVSGKITKPTTLYPG